MLSGTEENGWKSRVAEKRDIEADLARARARLANLDAERSDLQREVKALEVLLTSEQVPDAKQLSFENASVEHLVIALESRLISSPVRRSARCVSGAMGQQEDRPLWIFTGLCQRVGERHLREAEGQMRRMPTSEVHSA